MDERAKKYAKGEKIRAIYWMCKENISTFVEKILVNERKNVGRGRKILIKGEKYDLR